MSSHAASSTTNPTDATHLSAHRIPHLPSSFYYIPDFLTPHAESQLLHTVHAKPWMPLSRRRLQVYPAQLTAQNVLLSRDPLPEWLTEPLAARFAALGVFEGVPAGMNHVLVNNYRSGEGIMAHEDGAAYFPVTATVSLGSHAVLDVYEKGSTGEQGPRWRILQEPRSLLVTRDAAYSETLHGIAEVEGDEVGGVANFELLGEPERYVGFVERGERVSLTCRGVRRVSRLGGRLFGGR